MLLRHKKVLLFLSLIGILYSFKPLPKNPSISNQGNAQVSAALSTVMQNQMNDPISARFEQKLTQVEKDVKSYFPKLVDGRWDFFKNQNNDLSEDDIPNLKLIPVKVYTLDWLGLLNFNQNSSVEKLQTFDTVHTDVFGVKNNQIVVVIFSKYENGKWVNGGGYTSPFPELAKRIMEIIANKGEVYSLNVHADPKHIEQITQGYLVYNDGIQLMSIQRGGQSIPLKADLLDYKSRLKLAMKLGLTI